MSVCVPADSPLCLTMLTLSLTMLTLSLSLPWCHIPRNAMDSSTKLMSIARASLLRRGFASETLSLPGVRVLLPLSLLNVRCRLSLLVLLLLLLRCRERTSHSLLEVALPGC